MSPLVCKVSEKCWGFLWMKYKNSQFMYILGAKLWLMLVYKWMNCSCLLVKCRYHILIHESATNSLPPLYVLVDLDCTIHLKMLSLIYSGSSLNLLTSKVWLFPSSGSIFLSGLLRECSLSNYLLILITCLMSNVSI